ncbi:hypothetical protein [Novosphingobium sp. Chol11]|uniref:hypothetical protein n=1 Tax=Novosphingobium sp. Chol11 TaxID=1385763 RepID=UPI0026008E51|nr:hypothetical protein [Novosphingobium sp. Chol11]
MLRFADDGKVDCPNDNPNFTAVAGSRFGGHPPIAPFKFSVTRSDHPMTANLRGFRVEEELYLVHRTAVLDLLLHASFTGTCPKLRDES